MQDIIRQIEAEQYRETSPFRAGDTVRVHVRIREGDKERTQAFEGVVIALKRGGARASFTVRKVSYGVGVERVFPLHAPSIERVEVVTRGKVRQAKPFYLRGLRGKAARIKEREVARPTAAAAKAAADAAAAAAVAPDAPPAA